MRSLALVFTVFLFSKNQFFAQHTFSIVAVDTITGEIGSAGASCLDDNQFPGSGGAYIISDLLPGVGAIHTQAYYHQTNQANARKKMEEGLSPAAILTWLHANDAQGGTNNEVRQYGIVEMNPPTGAARAAAFTGQYCSIYKNHVVGPTYAIQGNILKNKGVLDSMEARFLRAKGTLADRLMESLQGANIVGADTRCKPNNTSSLSAFLRVAKPTDNENALYLDLNVPSLPAMTEPIDSLQTLYDAWKLTGTTAPTMFEVKLFPNPGSQKLNLHFTGRSGWVEIFDLSGVKIFENTVVEGLNEYQPKLEKGAYLVKITADNKTMLARKLFWQ